MKSCVAYHVKGKLNPDFVYREYCERTLECYCLRISEITNQPITEGKFCGCYGRLVGNPEVMVSLNMIVEETESPDTFSASIGCWEAPGKKNFFQRFPITDATTANLAVVCDALRTAIEEDPEAINPVWMELKEWCSAEDLPEHS